VIDGKRHSIARFYTYSSRTQQVVYVAELHHPLRAVARCHTFLYAKAGTTTSVIEELFVLPRFRRRGYGSLLERDASRTASAFGCEMIDISLHEADALPRTKPSAIAFGESVGYQWRQESGRRPNMVAAATRSLKDS
jgi:GNAT superfamily N-acetyltransferase